MGKALILENLGQGQYRIEYLQDRVAADKAKDKLLRWKSYLEAKIPQLRNNDPDHKLAGYVLGLESLKKQLQLYDRIPPNRIFDTWCVDYSLNLTGIVGTAEINNDPDGTVLICPGFRADERAYDQAVDGAAQHTWAQTAEQWFYNEAMRPGWQKWQPTFRIGTITEKTHSMCTVALDIATTMIRDFGEPRSINQYDVLTNVPIEYMDCDGSVFYVGARVVVEFGSQVAAYPKVIGFPDHPRPQTVPFVVYQGYKDGDNYYLGIYNWNGERIYSYDINAINGIPATWPVMVLGSSEEANAVFVLTGKHMTVLGRDKIVAALCTVPITWEYPGNDVYEIGFLNHSDDFDDDLLKMDYRTGIGPDGYFMAAAGYRIEPAAYTRHAGTSLIGMFVDTMVGKTNLNVVTVVNRHDRYSSELTAQETYINPAKPLEGFQQYRCGYYPDYQTPEDGPCVYPPEFSDHYVAVQAVGMKRSRIFAAVTCGIDTASSAQTWHSPYSSINHLWSSIVELKTPKQDGTEFPFEDPGRWPWLPYDPASPMEVYNSSPWFFTGSGAADFFNIVSDFVRDMSYTDIRAILQIFSTPEDSAYTGQDGICIVSQWRFEICDDNLYPYSGKTYYGTFGPGEIIKYDGHFLFACCVPNGSTVAFYNLDNNFETVGSFPLIGANNFTPFRNFAIANIPSECMALDLLNALRAKYGVVKYPAVLSRALSRVAQAHVDWMIENNIDSHTGSGNTLPADRGRASGFWSASEVLGQKTKGRTSRMYDELVTLFNGWDESPGHRNALIYPLMRQMGFAWGTFSPKAKTISHGAGSYDFVNHTYTTDVEIQQLTGTEIGNTRVFCIMVSYA